MKMVIHLQKILIIHMCVLMAIPVLASQTETQGGWEKRTQVARGEDPNLAFTFQDSEAHNTADCDKNAYAGMLTDRTTVQPHLERMGGGHRNGTR